MPDLLKKSTAMAALVAAFLLVISIWVSPWAELQIQTIRAEGSKEATVAAIEAGKFNDLQKGKGVFYAERVNGDNTFSNVFIYLTEHGAENVYTAPSARIVSDKQTNTRFLTLDDGTRFEMLPDKGGYRHYLFERSGVRLDPPEFQGKNLPVRALTTAELLTHNTLRAQTELQWRWSLPLCAFILVHIGVLLSRTQPRQGRFGKLLAGLLVFVFYFYSLTLTRKMIVDQSIPVELGMWWVHGLAITFLFYLYYRQYGIPGRRVTA